MTLGRLLLVPALAALVMPKQAWPDSGHAAWLRYDHIADATIAALYDDLPATVVALDDAPEVLSAQSEIIRAIHQMLGRTLRKAASPQREPMILLGTERTLKQRFPAFTLPPNLTPDSYVLKRTVLEKDEVILVAGPDPRGVLYGAFALVRHIALHRSVQSLDEESTPYAPVRWVNEWDNLDGSVERGYAGRSIFFADNSVLPDLSRAGDYARLLASIGVNGCTVNNVNSNPLILTPAFIRELARIANVFRPWGVRLSVAVDFSSPKTVGGLDTFDPLDARVAAWWKQKASEVYHSIPDLAGFVLKADSEGRVGPSTYGRTHADAANVIADALKPHGGILIYRGFVYNHHMDWRDLKNDRARAAYDNFHPLDGKFADNALIQIKYGPIDFQAREPVSPLIAAMPHTSETLELQITQEYTGQQRHLCYLVPMWKEILDFDFGGNGGSRRVKDIVSGKATKRSLGGFVGVANVGQDENWMGSDLAMANLYGFGRLAWNPDFSAEQITRDWTMLTFGHNRRVVETITALELESWHVYEGYTGPLGLGTLTNILRGHYGPGIESAERNGWGQWLRADEHGIGMDRTVKTGTGYIGQYPPEVADLYEPVETCPDELALFMHHLPYTARLHSGKTVIQHVYDSHYDAARRAQTFAERWEGLERLIDDERYKAILLQLRYQAGHAIVWRDAICTWFLRMSGVADEKGRAGHFPNRIEAENMHLTQYEPADVSPSEDASGGRMITCEQPSGSCTASFPFDGANGWYDVNIQYFDTNNGSARFQLFDGPQLIAEWSADANLPSQSANGDTSTRKRAARMALRRGDEIRIVGIPKGGDKACLDYVEMTRSEER